MAKVKVAKKAEPNYFVQLEGVKQAALVHADSKSEAREKFTDLFGILSTDRKIVVKTCDDPSEYTVDANGVIDPATL